MYNLNYLLELITGNFGLEALYLQNNNQVYSHVNRTFCEDCPLKIYQQCKRSWRVGSAIARKLNEPYIYFCPQGLSFVIVASYEQKCCLHHDCLVVGPVLAGNQENNYRHKLQALRTNDEEWDRVISKLTSYTENKLFYLSDLIYLAYRAIIYGDIINENVGNIKSEQSLLAETDVPYNLVDSIGELSEMLSGGISVEEKEILSVAARIMETTQLEECGNLKRIKAKSSKIIIYLYSVCKEKMGSLLDISERQVLEDINILTEACTFLDVKDRFLNVVGQFCRGKISAVVWPDSQLIQRMQKIVLSSYMKPLSLGNIAEQLHVSYTYLSALINRTLGKGFSQYLKEVRIQASKPLLENNMLSIAGVAYQVGFSDQSHFSKSFRSVTGMSPQQYRKQRWGMLSGEHLDEKMTCGEETMVHKQKREN